MQITLDIFSGRPNPTWKLNAKDAKKLLERVESRALTEVETVDNVLGYRGIIVSVNTDDVLPTDLPSHFRIGGDLPAGFVAKASKFSALSLDDSDEAVRWLLSKANKTVDEELADYVQQTLKANRAAKSSGKSAESASSAEADKAAEAEARAAACIIANTPYNPGFWNVPSVQPKNNCYNYAMNYRSDTFAQPGRRSGHMYTALNCANVGTAANWDGCKTTCSGSNKNVALVIWPGRDYHWYRKHSNGFWGHKPGQTAARNTDNAGILINGTTRTPANCNRGPYTVFCGYRFSPTGMIVK